MSRFAIVVLPLALLALGYDPKDPPEKPAAKTVKVTRGLCKVDVSLHGVLAAGETTEVRFSPKAWAGPFTIRKVAEHGTTVKKGDVLVELDPEKLDQALRDLETEQRISELAIHQADAELPVMAKLMPIELVESERQKKQAIEDQDRFLKTDRPHAEASAKERVKSATHYVEYAREELKQLQKMYRDKDLTEETEEIILKRQRHQVEEAEFGLKSAKLYLTETLEVTLPRKEITVRDAARKLTLAHDKAQATLPLNLSQKKLTLEKLRQELEKSRERYTQLKQDRALTTLVAPADGIVIYGRAVHGQFAAGPSNPAAMRLVAGGSLSPDEVFMTVTAPRPALAYATAEEKDLHLLKASQTARVTPAGYPDLKLSAKVKSVDPVRQPTGNFLAVVALDAPPEADLRPAMNCTVRIQVYEKANALLVPTAAIQHEEADEDQAYVNLVEGNRKFLKRAVKLGKTMGSKTEVLEGVKEGDDILAAKPEEQ
jgi:HlyD family secretion protein